MGTDFAALQNSIDFLAQNLDRWSQSSYGSRERFSAGEPMCILGTALALMGADGEAQSEGGHYWLETAQDELGLSKYAACQVSYCDPLEVAANDEDNAGMLDSHIRAIAFADMVSEMRMILNHPFTCPPIG